MSLEGNDQKKTWREYAHGERYEARGLGGPDRMLVAASCGGAAMRRRGCEREEEAARLARSRQRPKHRGGSTARCAQSAVR